MISGILSNQECSSLSFLSTFLNVVKKYQNTQFGIALIVLPSQSGRVGARGGAVCVGGAESTTATIPQKCQIQEWN